MAQTPVTFTQDQFDEFARLSGDDNPIHVDGAFAARTRFGRTVAHGMHLFGVLQAEIARTIGGPLRLSIQDLVFLGPTFADEQFWFNVDLSDDGTIAETITDDDGNIVTEGSATLAKPADGDVSESSVATDAAVYKGLQVGMTASRSRVFTSDDIADYLRLVDDPNPLYGGGRPELPPPLLGGMVSWLLGVDLPGRGTNWLKQQYRFHQPVTAPAEVTTTVTVVRLRPEKGLVNLDNRCTVDGESVVTGSSLVLAKDIAAP